MSDDPADEAQACLRVLIVEDEVLIALALEALLEEAGHTPVGIATTSTEAIALGRALEPDIALVDVHLVDGPTGIDVARALTRTEATTVVFTTANSKRIPDDFAGAAGVIGKPYSGRVLRSALRFIAGHRNGSFADAPPDGMTLSPRLNGANGTARQVLRRSA